MQDLTRIHTQIGIVFQFASSGLDGDMIAMLTSTCRHQPCLFVGRLKGFMLEVECHSHLI